LNGHAKAFHTKVRGKRADGCFATHTRASRRPTKDTDITVAEGYAKYT
jgi:hypothetical protein